MAAFVGRQSDLRDMLKSLIDLDYDALHAYDAAIARLRDNHLKIVLESFRADHTRHIRDLALSLRQRNEEPPTGADFKGLLQQGKVVIGKLVGDKGILMAMRSNESEINLAYEQALDRDDLDAHLAHLLQDNLDDERRHRNWIEDQLSVMGERPWDDDHSVR